MTEPNSQVLAPHSPKPRVPCGDAGPRRPGERIFMWHPTCPGPGWILRYEVDAVSHWKRLWERVI